jgi:hypothetical protein
MRDSLGRRVRPLRYPVKRTVRLSQDAADTLEEMAQSTKGGKYKVMKIMRRAIMKDVYIYKAEKKRRGEA